MVFVKNVATEEHIYKEAKKVILEKRDILEKGAALLIEKEKIGKEEFEALYHGDEN